MPRINIDDLPTDDQDLTPEELAQLEGAGRHFRPTVEALEGRDMYAANLGSALTPALLPPVDVARGGHFAQQAPLVNEVQVGGVGNTASPLAHLTAAGAGKGGVVNPLAPNPTAARQAFEARYEYFWNTFVCGGGKYNGVDTMRVRRPHFGSDSVSEGTAYAMLMTAFSKNPQAQERFRQLWAYAQSKFNEHGLMSWNIDAGGRVTSQGAATDADEDMAFALIQAYKNGWGESYKEDALKLLSNIQKYEVQPGTNTLLPGDMWGADGPTHINPSYFAPAYYRVFEAFTKKYDPDPSVSQRWAAVRERCYELLAIARQKAGDTGLVPDWMTQQGDKAPPTQYRPDYSYDYGYDAMRTPWRFALDALWYGDQRAIDYLKKVNGFFQNGGGIPNIGAIYSTVNGKPLDRTQNAADISMAATAAIVDADAGNRQAFWDAMTNTGKRPNEDWYYNEALRTQAILLTGGLMEKPVF